MLNPMAESVRAPAWQWNVLPGAGSNPGHRDYFFKFKMSISGLGKLSIPLELNYISQIYFISCFAHPHVMVVARWTWHLEFYGLLCIIVRRPRPLLPPSEWERRQCAFRGFIGRSDWLKSRLIAGANQSECSMYMSFVFASRRKWRDKKVCFLNIVDIK